MRKITVGHTKNIQPKKRGAGMHSILPRLYRLPQLVIGREADKGLLFKLFVYLILIDIAYIYVNPILFMVTTMVKNTRDLLDPAVTWVPTFLFGGHLAYVWKAIHYPTSFMLSMTISLAVALLQVVSCSVAGYAFARLQFPFKRVLFICLIVTFIIPPQMTILPMILVFKEFGWLNTYLPLLVPALFGHGLKGALFVIIFRQFFATLPRELEEAAKMDGANVFRTYFKVMLPLAKPAIIVVFLFSFVWNWNDYYLPAMFMFGSQEVPLSLSLPRLTGMLTQMEAEQRIPRLFNEPIKMAGGFLVIVPPLIVYFFMQRWFVEGVERTGIVE